MAYVPPTVSDLGSLSEVTLMENKIGRKADGITTCDPAIVGTPIFFS